MHADVPEAESDFVPDHEPDIPMGIKGAGEIGTVGTAAAIANAVWHATGFRQPTLPVCPDRAREEHGPVPWITGQSPRSRRRAMTVPATHQMLTGRPRGEKHEVPTLWADRLASRTGHWRIRARSADMTLQEKRPPASRYLAQAAAAGIGTG